AHSGGHMLEAIPSVKGKHECWISPCLEDIRSLNTVLGELRLDHIVLVDLPRSTDSEVHLLLFDCNLCTHVNVVGDMSNIMLLQDVVDTATNDKMLEVAQRECCAHVQGLE